MVKKNTQQWLDEQHPDKEERKDFIKFSVFRQELEGDLELSDFVNLEEIECSSNFLTRLILPTTNNLKIISCYLNNINQDLNIFSHLTKLEGLDLGIKSLDIKNNNFHGSLKSLENCLDLEYICIGQQTRITEGLEFFPAKKLDYFGCHGTVFAETLKPYNFDVYAWQLANVKEKFNLEDLVNKIEDAKKEIEKETKENKKLRLESKLQLLEKKLLEHENSTSEIINSQPSSPKIEAENDFDQSESEAETETEPKTVPLSQILLSALNPEHQSQEIPLENKTISSDADQSKELELAREIYQRSLKTIREEEITELPKTEPVNKEFFTFSESPIDEEESKSFPVPPEVLAAQEKAFARDAEEKAQARAKRAEKDRLDRIKALAQSEAIKKAWEEKLQREQEQIEQKKREEEEKRILDENKNPNPESNQKPDDQPKNNDQPKKNSQPSFFTRHAKLKKASLWSGGAVGGLAVFATLATGVGYVAAQGAAVLGAVKSATGFATVIAKGTSAQAIASKALAGLGLKSYLYAGLSKIGGVISGATKGLGAVLISSPWIWVPLTVLAVAGVGFLVYKKWNSITGLFTKTEQKVEQVVEEISEPASHVLRPFLMEETAEEKQLHQLNQQAANYQAQINQLEQKLEAKEEEIVKLEQEKDNHSDCSESVFEQLKEELTEQKQALTEQLSQIQEQIKETEKQQQEIPLKVHQSLQAKEEQLKNTVHKGVKYSLYFVIVLSLIIMWKLIAKIYHWLFNWTKKTSDQTLRQIQERVNAMAAEIEAERIYQQLQKIKRENEIKDEVITKTELKSEPIVIKLEQPAEVKNKINLDQRKKDRLNAKRRARYQLKKLVKSKPEIKLKNKPVKGKRRKSKTNLFKIK